MNLPSQLTPELPNSSPGDSSQAKTRERLIQVFEVLPNVEEYGGVLKWGYCRYPNSWRVFVRDNPNKMDDFFAQPYFRKPPSWIDVCKAKGSTIPIWFTIFMDRTNHQFIWLVYDISSTNITPKSMFDHDFL